MAPLHVYLVAGVQQVPTLLDLSDMPFRRIKPKPLTFSSLFCCMTTPELTLRGKLSRLEIPLSNPQIDEIIQVTQVVWSRVLRDSVVNLRIGFELNEITRTTMGYLVRGDQDIVVYPKILSAEGSEKDVRIAIAISEEGAVELLEEVRVKKSIRSERANERMLREYIKRGEFSKDFVCAPGDIYQYIDKAGTQKLSWLVPHYTTCGGRFAFTLRAQELRKRKFPYLQTNCLQFIIGAANALQHIHDKDQLHRDIKLANILFSISPKTKQIESVVLTDLSYTRGLEEIQRHRESVFEILKNRHRFAELKITNPIFNNLCMGDSIPSTSNYVINNQYAKNKDPEFAAVTAFLEELDSCLKVGTPGHIPPEFWHSRSYSKAGDIYALGITFQMLLNVIEEEEIYFSDITTYHFLEMLVQQMCGEDPEGRPSIAIVVARLRDILKQEHID